jgi:hypothetical protein
MAATLGGLKVTPLSVSAAKTDGGTQDVRLTFVMQPQETPDWCWSAVGTSVGLFYRTGNWTQSDTVNHILGRTDCGVNPKPRACLKGNRLDRSLTYTKSLNRYFETTIDSVKIKQQIDEGRPVCVRVAWRGGGAHFLAITAYIVPPIAANFRIRLQDSIYGTIFMLLTDFPASYHGGGTWSHTYLTKAN